MATRKIQTIRERIPWVFYDTMLSPWPSVQLGPLHGNEGEARRLAPSHEITQQEMLFGVRNVGLPLLCNLYMAACLCREDESFYIHAFSVKAWFEGPHEQLWGEVYPQIESGLTINPTIGITLRPPAPVKYERVADDQSRVLNMHHRYETPVIVPARQSFTVSVESNAEVRDLINKWKGKRFFRVFVEGVMSREIQ